MPRFTPVATVPRPSTPLVSSGASLAQLIQRLSTEVIAAEKRVEFLQSEAAHVIVGRDQRLVQFLAVADQIDAILRPRLDALRNLSVFNDITQSVRLDIRRLEGKGFHGRTITLTVPASDKRPAPMEFSFRVGHDGPVENATIDYRLEILPIFIKFDSHQQLAVSIDSPQEKIITEWIDDNLIGFTKTYFEVYFNNEYQKKSLEMDPVLNIRFPRAFAAGSSVFKNRTFYFYTPESLQLFEQEPPAYVQNESHEDNALDQHANWDVSVGSRRF